MPTPFDLIDCELELFIQIHYPISIESPLKQSAYCYGTKLLRYVSDRKQSDALVVYFCQSVLLQQCGKFSPIQE